ncbi:MAG: adenylosuccinate lyase [Bacteroidetes bacterium]|nr:adenylosuccinate lyase [Bacteroidota bacterium]MBU1580415.1 adenylosuccinate lyase [Bacteroidota bacterium]MBU2556170.1 adenylosuccinate lyase [Bacteroidota bacterium]
MQLSALTAISPVDGRYRNKTSELADFFSEYALIRYRVMVEVNYFIALCELPLPQLAAFKAEDFDQLHALYEEFTLEDALEIKEIEKETNHDVKAVEYFLKRRFDDYGWQPFKEFIHFGLTSQDINNVALPLSIKDAHKLNISREIESLQQQIIQLSYTWKDVSMLARTHGQPASPTKLGKELYVFAERLENQFELLKGIPFSAKFGGATGNFNAHAVAYPEINWEDFACNFINQKLELHRQRTTTQIEHYDYLAAYFDGLKRINTILLDLSRDIWLYVSMDYFKQQIKAGEVGSSAMPHKVNPIDFENAEGNLGIANAIFEHLSAKLPLSRLQRDLTDSTVTRNIGVPLSHTLIAIKSIRKGLGKLLLNEKKIAKDLQNNTLVVAEGIQTILRREGVEGAYELLKQLTRTNEKIDKNTINTFIETLPVSESVKKELRAITPESYTGIDLLSQQL